MRVQPAAWIPLQPALFVMLLLLSSVLHPPSLTAEMVLLCQPVVGAAVLTGGAATCLSSKDLLKTCLLALGQAGGAG